MSNPQNLARDVPKYHASKMEMVPVVGVNFARHQICMYLLDEVIRHATSRSYE